MRASTELKRITRELDKLALDVSEIEAPGDAQYQSDRLDLLTKRLKAVTDKVEETEIHGSGTGKD